MLEKRPNIIARKRIQAETVASLTNRDLREYEKFLGIDFSTMKGKLLLDLGSGSTEIFSKEAQKLGVKVFSMNPQLKDLADQSPVFREYFLKDWQKRSVAGRAQQIPFLDNTFDFTTALFSVPLYLPVTNKDTVNYNEYKLLLKEAVRTLKPRGKAYFFPIKENQLTVTKKIIEELSGFCEGDLIKINDPSWGICYKLIITKN